MKNFKQRNSISNSKKLTKSIFLTTFLIICIIFIVYFSSMFFYSYNLNYYEKKYQEYKIYNLFQKEIAINKTLNIFGYLQYREDLDKSFFNQKEESHLNDVRVILKKIDFIYKISLVSFFIILFYFTKKKDFKKIFNAFIYSGLIGISFILIIGMFYFIAGFDVLFEYFHIIFFKDNYSFDPRFSNMKALFPDEFFLDMGKAILILAFIKFINLIIFGFILKRKLKNKKY